MPYLGFNPSFTSEGAITTLADTTTIGDGTAEDVMIKFDGNTADYHIGLDDSGDKLTMGKGAALGTTASMTFDTNGIILKPLQPCFKGILASNVNNMATNTEHDIQISTEVDDLNGDFNTSNYTFTAPVTGKYFLSCLMRIDAIDANGTNFNRYKIVTSNASYTWVSDPKSWGVADYEERLVISAYADMDASDTAKLTFYTAAGAAQADQSSGSTSAIWTSFYGYLVN
tara:strand:- start:1914 stop:2597 length:684 start_codon:yes stop_codon:yes gene_type:complete